VRAVKKDYYYSKKDELKITKNIILNSSVQKKEATVFFDTGKGFNQNEILQLPFDGNSVSGNIALPPNLIGLRFDPIEGSYCVVKHFEVLSEQGWLEYTPINGYSMGGYHVFLTKDPQFLIDNISHSTWIKLDAIVYTFSEDMMLELLAYMKEFMESMVKKMENCNCEKDENIKNIEILTKQLHEQQMNSEILTKQLHEQQEQSHHWHTLYSQKDEEVKNIISSTAWKLTKPYRWIGSKLKRRKKK
jgi:hypothetical protein